MSKLIRFKKYSRKDIHDLFSPNTEFHSGAGSWGAQGMIRVPNTLHDYVFLVTYGRKIASHEFDEQIDENGVLTWQSKPSEGLNDTRVKDYINHDYLKNNIYLFLRTNGNEDYSYMGKLAYVEHDNQREHPVYFKWQILDWDSTEAKKYIDSRLLSNSNSTDVEQFDVSKFNISISNIDLKTKKVERKGKTTSEFKNRSYDFEGNASKNTKLGSTGEDIVVMYEKRELINNGREDLAEQVMKTSDFAGNSESFDILSYDLNGNKKYIEVKTTTGGIENLFYISENEVLFSEEFSENYYLYRLYNFNKKEMHADMTIIKGALNRNHLNPINYVCRLGD